MAKKKNETSAKTPAINFRCSPELKRDLEDLAHLSRRDVSSLMLEMATELVKANRARITKFRQSAAVPIKMPFASSKPAAPPAQIDTVIATQQSSMQEVMDATAKLMDHVSKPQTIEVKLVKSDMPPHLAKTQYLIDVKPASDKGGDDNEKD